MKRALLFLFALLLVLFTEGQTVQRNLVVMEVETCTNAWYDPGAALGAMDLLGNGCQVAVIGYHFNLWGQPEPFTTPSSAARVLYYGMQGTPDAFFDGVQNILGANHYLSMYPFYLPVYNQRYSVPSPLTVDLSGFNTGNMYTVNVMVSKLAPVASPDLRLQLVLTESGIPYNWMGQTVVNNAVRTMIPDAGGTAVDFSSGDVQNYILSFQVDPSWITSDCELIAFVQDNSTKECLNAAECSLADLPLKHDLPYCLPSYLSGCSGSSGLTDFRLNTINKAISCSGSPSWYHDYTDMTASLTAGSASQISMKAGSAATYASIWIDYNENGIFEENELIGQAICALPGTTYNLDFTVPFTAIAGCTRLRIMTSLSGYPAGPCSAQLSGNCCDFSVDIRKILPAVITSDASSIGSSTATLNGMITAGGNLTTASFQYGLTTSYGSVAAASPATVNGNQGTAVSSAISGLSCGTTYHYRAVGTNEAGTTFGNDVIFSTDGSQVPVVTIIAIPANNVFTGGLPSTIYLGYGPQSVTLSATATGGTGFSYTWNSGTAGLAGLSCTECREPVFTPGQEGKYQFTVNVTNSVGCSSSSSIIICVIDIRVPGQNNKVYLCHNQGSPQSISVSVNAVPAHVPGHPQDHLGGCNQSCDNIGLKSSDISGAGNDLSSGDLTLAVYPNPVSSEFTVFAGSGSAEEIVLYIYDMTGRILLQQDKLRPNTAMRINCELECGIYLLRITQDDRECKVRIVRGRQ